MKTDWVNDNGTWYYLSQDGSMQTGVISVGDKVYYLSEDVSMQTGSVVIDGKTYQFNASGEAVGEIPKVDSNKVFGVGENTGNQTSQDTQTTESSTSSGNRKPSKKKIYSLVWSEDFDGDELNEEYWNYEKRAPGWANNELQEYTDSEENIYLEDGNLVIKAIKEQRDGKDYYTSGKITTQNKKTFTYGKFEIRAKSPAGRGLWPALWMMPNDESLYGQWPKCGEIDIMEILGHEPNKVYGTIHYGDPHEEKQDTYVLEEGTFADDYHVYGVEWEPGEIRFTIDGIVYNTAKDWFSKVEGGDEIAYPAPFDQPFYLQCNLAVGGSWPGDPDESTDFDNAEFKIDYIKVYQLDEYNENVKKPEAEEIILREPDKTGNYIINGDFSKGEEGWKFATALNGEGNYEVADNKFILKPENEGSADYSVQLTQSEVPLEKNAIYKLSFDAKSETEERTMKVGISGPHRSFIRYFGDTLVELTPEKKTYEFEFTMEKNDDPEARLEFNLGKQGSIDNVELSNIRLEKMGKEEVEDDGSKKIMPDGNYVNNGGFEVGQNRMEYWEVESKSNKAKVDVTNINNSRELRVNVRDTKSSLQDVIVKQTNLAIKENNKYILSFDAYAAENKTIEAHINGEVFEAELTKEKKTYKFELNTGDKLINSDLEFLLGLPGVTYLDNVRIEENAVIKNGLFDSGLAGWEVFADKSGDVSYKAVNVVNEGENANKAAQITIKDTGDAAWKVQLKQGNVKLEQGKAYRLSFDAKSTVARDISFAMQKDGSNNGVWDSYASNTASIGPDGFTKCVMEFEMTKATDNKAIFSIAMGAIDRQIDKTHSILIDNVILEEIEEIEDAGPLVNNGDFSDGFNGWYLYSNADDSAEATESTENGAAEITINNTGTAGHSIQLQQKGIKLKQGQTYKLSFKAKSTSDRNIAYSIQNNENYTSYFKNQEVRVIGLGSEYEKYEITFTMNEATDYNAALVISLGAVDGLSEELKNKQHVVTIDDIKLEKVEGPVIDEIPSIPADESIIQNGDFSNGFNPWYLYADTADSAEAKESVENGAAEITINNTGTASHSIQLQQKGIKLIQDETYKLSFKAKSTSDRNIAYCIQNDDNYISYFKNQEVKVVSLGNEYAEYEVTFTMNEATDNNAVLAISMGAVDGLSEELKNKQHVVTIDDIKLEKVEKPVVDEVVPAPSLPIEDSILENGDFSNGLDNWSYYNEEGTVSFSSEDGKAKIDIKNVDSDEWKYQLKQEGISLEKGKTYKLSFYADSTIDRKIKFAVQRNGNEYTGDEPDTWKPYSQVVEVDVTQSGNRYYLEFTMEDESDDKAILIITMSAIGNDPIVGEHTIRIDDVILVEAESETIEVSENILVEEVNDELNEEIVADEADKVVDNNKVIVDKTKDEIILEEELV